MQIVIWDKMGQIAAAWIITIPVSGLLAAMLYFMIHGMMLP